MIFAVSFHEIKRGLDVVVLYEINMERRIGIIVNPDAGLGGRLALKGSDGMAEMARAKGAEDRAGPRMYEALEHLSSLIELSLVPWDNVHWLLPKGRMGDSWIPENENSWEMDQYFRYTKCNHS